MNTESKEQSSVGFADLGLSKVLTKTLTRRNFVTPTPIQEKAIPVAITGKDVMGIAQTGTGKTLAFFLPMLQRIAQTDETGLIIVPTRELAGQVREEIDKVGRPLGFKTALLIGGSNMMKQIHILRRKPHIVVATPGRLNDHIERKSIKLNRVGMLVLDEADRMLDMGFAPQIDRVLQAVPDERQTLLFSATLPDGVVSIAKGYMRNPVRIEVAPSGTTAKNINQGIYYVEGSNKLPTLKNLLKEHDKGPVLIFCRTKYGTQKMARTLKKSGFNTEELHSNRSTNQRRIALENFKCGKSRVMVATDVAARGIDVKEITLVVNYDLPDQLEDYVHRIGRTGRAGHKGQAVSFAAPDQKYTVKEIEHILGRKIPVLEMEGTLQKDEIRLLEAIPKKRGRGRGRRGFKGKKSVAPRQGAKKRRYGKKDDRQGGGSREKDGASKKGSYTKKKSTDEKKKYGSKKKKAYAGKSKEGGSFGKKHPAVKRAKNRKFNKKRKGRFAKKA